MHSYPVTVRVVPSKVERLHSDHRMSEWCPRTCRALSLHMVTPTLSNSQTVFTCSTFRLVFRSSQLEVLSLRVWHVTRLTLEPDPGEWAMGPDNTHPRLVFIATIPDSPHFMSPVKKDQ